MKLGMKTKLATAALSLVLAVALILSGTGLLGASFGSRTVYADEAYGEKAYEYMKKMSQEYSFRISTQPANAECRAWLKKLVSGWGYKISTSKFDADSTHGWGRFSGESLIFDKKGKTDRMLLICAHYDSAWAAGCDDNGSGVGVLLENAERVAKMDLPYSVRFALFDGEEPGCLGSTAYVQSLSQEELDRILCVINLDSVAAGDHLMIYSGNYDAATATFSELWPLYSAQELADEFDIKLSLHPEVNGKFPVPSKMTGSDHAPFAAAGKPYIYFEASNWMGGDWDNFYQTDSPLVEKGKIMHNEQYDNFEFLDANFKAQIQKHLAEVSQLVYAMMIGYMEIPKDVLGDVDEPTTEDPSKAETPTSAPVENPTNEDAETKPSETTAVPGSTAEESASGEDITTTADATTAPETSTEEETTTAEPTTAEPTTEEPTTVPETTTEEVTTTVEENTTEAASETTAAATEEETTTEALIDKEEGGSGVNWIAILIAAVILLLVGFLIFLFTLSMIQERRAQNKRDRKEK